MWSLGWSCSAISWLPPTLLRLGDESALEKLVPLVYNELRRLAQGRMRLERPDHTLQTTALINEAYLRLVDARNVRWQSRAHFFALCARLTFHARKSCVTSRGCSWVANIAVPLCAGSSWTTRARATTPNAAVERRPFPSISRR